MEKEGEKAVNGEGREKRSKGKRKRNSRRQGNGKERESKRDIEKE